MIDINKYEGHDDWEGTKVNMANEANRQLIADAPKLLAEVKRLRKQLGAYMRFQLWVQEKHNEIHDSYEEIDEL